MWKYIMIVVCLFSVTIAVLFCVNRRLNHTIADQSAKIEQMQIKIDTANAALKTALETAERGNKSQIILMERVVNGASEYAEKIREIETDGDACDWLDQRLPGIVREKITGCTANSDTGDQAAGSDADSVHSSGTEATGDKQGFDLLSFGTGIQI